jgi:dethiobiotin synthetase
VAARLLTDLRAAGATVAARKPAQSFDPSDDPVARDAAVLGAATGEEPTVVCPPHRWYETPMAPPMAADVLGRPSFVIEDLLAELKWSEPPVDVGIVETAGGVRSPLAADGDCLDLCAALAPDGILLVADAGLGTINAVRLTVDRLVRLGPPIVVVLNRFDEAADLHRRNRAWLRGDGLRTNVVPGDETELVDLARTSA